MSKSQTNPDFQVIIVGAGISGIGFACQLQRRLGCTQFMIYESQDGIGVNPSPPQPFHPASYLSKLKLIA